MKSLKSLIVAATLSVVCAPAYAASYVAYDQFAVSSGAITATNFAFGSSTGAFNGTITPFSTIESACGGNAAIQCAHTGEATVSKAAGAYVNGTSFYTANFLNMHSSQDNITASAVQFIAPTAGLYNFKGSYETHDTSPSGVDLAAYVGGAYEFSTYLGRGAYAFDFDAMLDADGRVSFLVGPAGDFRYDSTGLQLTVSSQDVTSGIPEPATWAMMIGGFGLVGAAARRRRAGVVAA